MKTVECKYITECEYTRTDKCKICANNTKRNYVESHFVKANDKPIPKENPRVSYSGPAEQTAGYKCPVCGGYTNPYQLNSEKLCVNCGFRLNTSMY